MIRQSGYCRDISVGQLANRSAQRRLWETSLENPDRLIYSSCDNIAGGLRLTVELCATIILKGEGGLYNYDGAYNTLLHGIRIFGCRDKVI